MVTWPGALQNVLIFSIGARSRCGPKYLRLIRERRALTGAVDLIGGSWVLLLEVRAGAWGPL